MIWGRGAKPFFRNIFQKALFDRVVIGSAEPAPVQELIPFTVLKHGIIDDPRSNVTVAQLPVQELIPFTVFEQ